MKDDETSPSFPNGEMLPDSDEKRRRAITNWWTRRSLDDFIARLKSRTDNAE